jgi:hypothetical protein
VPRFTRRRRRRINPVQVIDGREATLDLTDTKIEGAPIRTPVPTETVGEISDYSTTQPPTMMTPPRGGEVSDFLSLTSTCYRSSIR